MSDYTLSINWSGKDALSDSDAAKVISGSDFNSEFTTVRTAVNSKADLNGKSTESFAINNATIAGTLAVTGVPTVPTQTQGNNTTRVASTAFVTTAVAALNAAAINAIVYPVGSIYFNAAVATNPNTLLGFGTWQPYAAGRVMVGKHSSGTFDTLNEELGAETDSHALSIAELPAHKHTVGSRAVDTGNTGPSIGQSTTGDFSGNTDAPVGSTGSGSAHSHDILQPSITVYMWKRTA